MKKIILIISFYFVFNSGFSQICLYATNVTTGASTTNMCNGQSITLKAFSSPGTGCTVPLNVTWVKYIGVWQSIGSGTTITVSPTQNTQYGCYTSANPNNIASTVVFVANMLIAPTIISNGSLTICEGNTVNLSCSITETVTYQWKKDNINIGTNSTSYDATTSGTYNLEISNACGTVSSNNSINVFVNPTPINPGAISGTTTVCQGENSLTYTVPPITNATSYIWTLPTGATGTSSTNSITVNYGASAVSGNIIVKGNNSCGDGVSSTLSINVNIKPNTPIIYQTGNILNSDASSGNQWYNQNGLIVNAVSQNYNLVSDGNYYVIVTNSNGCTSNVSNILNAIVLGVNNYALDNLILYPNPIIKILHIEIEKEFTGTIYDITGKTLMNVNTKDIDVSSLSPGIYLLDIISENKHYTKKLIKQ